MPEDPSTQLLRFLAPDTINGMASGTRNRKSWVLGPSGHKTRRVYASTSSIPAVGDGCGLWCANRGLLPQNLDSKSNRAVEPSFRGLCLVL